MTETVDFGYEKKTTTFDKAKIVILFACGHPFTETGQRSGPSAVFDGAKQIELYEMQIGTSPLNKGVCTLFMDGEEYLKDTLHFAKEAHSQKKFTIYVTDNRLISSKISGLPVVELFGKTGRDLSSLNIKDNNRKTSDKESISSSKHPTITAGVRAATSGAFSDTKRTVTIITAKNLKDDKAILKSSLKSIKTPVHLCIDIDVFSPGVIQNSRSIEPGGLDWYDVTEIMDIVAEGPGIASIDITGTEAVLPNSPAAVLCAQMVLRSTALFNTGDK
ncbi:MAG: arginase family protein [Deltaproteobacteria bacterium]|nr:arginase family protein [Deltaproteobacteria bacterium]